MYVPSLENRNPPETNPMFKITPSSLQFNNFSIGQVLRQSINITNHTASTMDISIQFSHDSQIFFEVDFEGGCTVKPKESISASILFLPQLKEKIKETATVTFRSNRMTWKQKLSLECCPKHISIGSLNPLVDFGKVVFGERASRNLVILNEGEEKVQISFRTLKGEQLVGDEIDPYERGVLEQLSFEKCWKLDSSKLLVPITFFPNQLGCFQLQIQVYVLNHLDISPFRVIIKGECIEVPIYLEEFRYDMKICIIGYTYKEDIVVYNRSSSQLKIEVIQPPESQRYFEFTPAVGLIPGESTLLVGFKLHIFKDIVGTLQRFLEGDTYRIPFQIVSESQKNDVGFSIGFKITTDKLTISPMRIDFGNIYGGTGAKVNVTLKNESFLIQEVMLFPSSANIRVVCCQPIKILPKEEYVCQLQYITNSHNSEQPLGEEIVKCNVITGNVSSQEMNLTATCNIFMPQLQLNINKVHFPVLQLEESYFTEIKLINTTNQPLMFEIFLPPQKVCGLSMSPLVKVLGPLETTNIYIEYKSFFKNLNLEQLKNPDGPKIPVLDKLTNLILRHKTNATDCEEEVSTIEEYINILGGKYSRFNGVEYFEWLIPIYFKQKENPDASAEVRILKISTTSVEKTLILSEKVIDFGDVPVGSKVLKSVILTNLNETTEIWKTPLPIWSGFRVISTLKTLSQDSSQKVFVEFNPEDDKQFLQKLMVHSNKRLASLYLKGRGIRSSLSLTPSSGLLDMGCLMAGDLNSRQIQLRNERAFPTRFKLQVNSEGIRNESGFDVFSFIPKEGQIEPNGVVDIRVVFRPSRVSDDFYQLVHVQIPKQVPLPIYLWGQCKPQEGYISVYREMHLPTFQELTKPQAKMMPKDDPDRIELVFNRQDDSPNVKKIRIGNCRCSNQVKREIAFRIPLSDSRFKCNVTEGVIETGQEVIVSYEILVSEETQLINEIEVLREVGHWEGITSQIDIEVREGPIVVKECQFNVVLRVFCYSI